MTTGRAGCSTSRCRAISRHSREVLLSYAKPQPGGSRHGACARPRCQHDGTQLRGSERSFRHGARFLGGRHFGSRVVEAADGTLFLTIGDRGDRRRRRRTAPTTTARIVRLDRDGSVPARQPLCRASRRAARNLDFRAPQPPRRGARMANGNALGCRTWRARRGRSEPDRAKAPTSAGRSSPTGGTTPAARSARAPRKPGMEQPAHYWDPSIAPSGLMIYSGGLLPEWRRAACSGRIPQVRLHRARSRSMARPHREVAQIAICSKPNGCAISSQGAGRQRSGSSRWATARCPDQSDSMALNIAA